MYSPIILYILFINLIQVTLTAYLDLLGNALDPPYWFSFGLGLKTRVKDGLQPIFVALFFVLLLLLLLIEIPLITLYLHIQLR